MSPRSTAAFYVLLAVMSAVGVVVYGEHVEHERLAIETEWTYR